MMPAVSFVVGVILALGAVIGGVSAIAAKPNPPEKSEQVVFYDEA